MRRYAPISRRERKQVEMIGLREDAGLTGAFKEELYGEFSCTIT